MSQLIGGAHPRGFGPNLPEPQDVLDLMVRSGGDTALDAVYGDSLRALLPPTLDALMRAAKPH